MYNCQELFCFTLIPCVILSLVAIGVSSMLIYIHLMQQYQEKILKLQVNCEGILGFDPLWPDSFQHINMIEIFHLHWHVWLVFSIQK